LDEIKGVGKRSKGRTDSIILDILVLVSFFLNFDLIEDEDDETSKGFGITDSIILDIIFLISDVPEGDETTECDKIEGFGTTDADTGTLDADTGSTGAATDADTGSTDAATEGVTEGDNLITLFVYATLVGSECIACCSND
jgi:hypothetical protein